MTKFLFRNYISKNVCFLIVQYVSSSGCLPPGDVLSQSLYVLPSPPMCLKEKKKNMVMLVGIKLKLKYEINICNKINEVRKCLAVVENMVMLVGIKLKLKYERNICNKINEVRKCLAVVENMVMLHFLKSLTFTASAITSKNCCLKNVVSSLSQISNVYS
jgi:hypothetical protein